MIPKTIHCCWFSGEEKSSLAKKCVSSWRKFAPEYVIREWGAEDLKRIADPLPAFVRDALSACKWAFASDWARFAIIAAEGGVYLDMDVELVKPLDEVVSEGAFFALATDEPRWVDPGIGFAAEKGDDICSEIASKYETMKFDPACHLNQTCPVIANEVIEKFSDRRLLPATVFNPKGTCAGKICLTSDTVAIHHYAASWFNLKQKFAYKILPKYKLDWILRLWFRR